MTSRVVGILLYACVSFSIFILTKFLSVDRPTRLRDHMPRGSTVSDAEADAQEAADADAPQEGQAAGRRNHRA